MKKILLIATMFIGLIVLSAHSRLMQPGDILLYKGAFSHYIPNTIFEHVGIYIGNGQVVEFNGGNKGGGVLAPHVVKTSFHDFQKNSPDKRIYIIDIEKTLLGKTKFSPDVIADCAKQHLQDNGMFFGEYHPLNNNCQHFVSYCAVGEAISWQADYAVSVLSTVKKYSSTLSPIISTGETAINVVMDLLYLFG